MVLIYEKSEGIGTITLNRPDVLNALNAEMIDALSDALKNAERDEDVRSVVITGAGGNFSAGADISELIEKTPIHAGETARRIQEITMQIESMRKPVLAKIRGYCLGGGFEIALACDFRFASEDASFGFPEINLAIIPGGGGTQRLTRLVGKTEAAEILFTGERIQADRALSLHILNAVTSAAELDDAVNAFLKKLHAKSAVALSLLKRAINSGINMPLEHALMTEADCFTIAFATEDAQKNLKAFLKHRK